MPASTSLLLSIRAIFHLSDRSLIWVGWLSSRSLVRGSLLEKKKKPGCWLGSLWGPWKQLEPLWWWPFVRGAGCDGLDLAPPAVTRLCPSALSAEAAASLGLGGWGWAPPWPEGLTLCHLWLVTSARQGLGKEHEIEVINYQLSSSLIQIVKGLPLHLPCHEKSFTTSLQFTVFSGELKMEMERIC